MSALGQKWTFCIAAKGSLFDHLVGEREKRGLHFDTKRARGLEIEDEFQSGRPLHRHVGGLFPLQYPCRIGSHLIKLLANDCAVVHEPTLELASPHSITSSAIAMTPGGIV